MQQFVRTFSKVFPFCQVKIVFKITINIGPYLRFKDRILGYLQAGGVVYKYTRPIFRRQFDT